MINRLLKNVFLLLNYLVIGLLLVGYLATVVSPVKVPFLTFFSLLFPFIILLNIIAVIFWLFLKKYYFIFSFIVLLVGFNKVTDTFSVAFKKDEILKPADFSIMSYNVRVFDLYNWSHNKETRNNIFASLRQMRPDVACFQEYYNNSGNYFPVHDSLIKNQRFNYAHINYIAELPNKSKFGIATYSVYPIVNKEEVEFENSQNQILISDIKIKDDTLRVFNCHLESVRFLKEDYQFMDSINKVNEQRRKQGVLGVVTRLSNASKKRSKQADIIKQLIKISPYPVLVCGDFNDVPSSYTYGAVCGGLSDSHKENNVGIGGTYTRFFPSNRIDYILFDQNIQCHEFDRVKLKYSDHYPIIGKYSFVK